jgi:cell division protein FtsQ
VLLVIALIVGVAMLYNSQVFAVSAIEVTGVSRLTEDEVLTLAAVPSDATLLRFPAEGITERLLSNPWIAEAYVTRDFPDGMRVRIVERQPAAYLDLGQESVWVVDDTGVTIAEQSATETGTLVVVRDLQPIEPTPGEKTGSEPILNALGVWRGLSPELKERTRAISAPSIDRTTLVTHDDIEILVGAAEEMESKDLIAREILAEQAGSVVYINVRTIERPTWRGLERDE